jgi:hypothetical protein
MPLIQETNLGTLWLVSFHVAFHVLNRNRLPAVSGGVSVLMNEPKDEFIPKRALAGRITLATNMVFEGRLAVILVHAIDKVNSLWVEDGMILTTRCLHIVQRNGMVCSQNGDVHVQGLVLFSGQYECTSCHQPSNGRGDPRLD